MPYEVQKGDTIAKVTSLMHTDWQTLKRMNTGAVGRSERNGHWFLREGAVLRGSPSFEASLRERVEAGSSTTGTSGPLRGDESATEAERASGGRDGWTTYTIRPGDNLWSLAVRKFRVELDALAKANGLENPGLIHPGQVIRVPPPKTFPEEMDVVASWYGRTYHGRPMANGDFYNMYGDTIAHRDLPFGTRVELSNLETGERVTAVVRDRGPFVEGRDVDLSYGLARRLSMVEKGVGALRMKVLG